MLLHFSLDFEMGDEMEWEYDEDNDGFDDPNYVIGGTAHHCERLFSKYDDDANETPTNDASLEDITTYAGKISKKFIPGQENKIRYNWLSES